MSRKRFSRLHLLALCILVLVLAFTATDLVFTQPSSTFAASSAAKLSITFTCAQATDYHSGKVCVHTQAKTGLTIKVTYCSGYAAVSKSLKGTQYADAHGNHTWRWIPETKCRGKATARVTEYFNGHSLSVLDVFTVK